MLQESAGSDSTAIIRRSARVSKNQRAATKAVVGDITQAEKHEVIEWTIDEPHTQVGVLSSPTKDSAPERPVANPPYLGGARNSHKKAVLALSLR